MHSLKGYPTGSMCGYFDAYVQNIEAIQNAQAMQSLQTMQNLQTMQSLQTVQNLQAPQNTQGALNPNWSTTLVELQNQKTYLEDLLSKTAITLNTLRDRHARNDRALNDNPRPRLKKRKIQQNQWRTDKTIRTCEKEERVILDSLRVCETNINTLGAILYPTEASSFAADYSLGTSWAASHNDTESSVTDIDWNGWADEGPVSPFQRETRRTLSITSIAPEVTVPEKCPPSTIATAAVVLDGKPAPLPPRVQPATELEQAVPPPPPNTARSTQCNTLSPMAASFKADSSADDDEGDVCRRAMDKLSIESLLASKHMQRLKESQKKRFADSALSHLFARLSEHHGMCCHRLGLRRGTSCPQNKCRATVDCWKATGLLKRSTSI